MRLAVLGSGSRGNATLVEAAGESVLVDCGFSIRETEKRLFALDCAPEDISAVLVTHEHSDHSKGVRSFAEKHGLPVYATHGTAVHKSLLGLQGLREIVAGQAFTIGGLRVEPVTVPHDAREPCQYIFEHAGQRLGILTDLGHVSPRVEQSYSQCHMLFIEANHDEVMLAGGPYPPALKRRVGGAWGHLSNRQTAAFLATVCQDTLKHLVLGHVSEKNNSSQLVKQMVADVALQEVQVTFAAQDEIVPWIELPH